MPDMVCAIFRQGDGTEDYLVSIHKTEQGARNKILKMIEDDPQETGWFWFSWISMED